MHCVPLYSVQLLHNPSSQSMMDAKLASASNKKRKLDLSDSAATQRILSTKKPKTGTGLPVNRPASSSLNHVYKSPTTPKHITRPMAKTTRPNEQNAKAGSSKGRNVILSPSPASTPTRVSSRVSRPTPKKAAAEMVSLESDSDFGSGDDPPLGIIKTPKRKKTLKKKMSQKEPSYSTLVTPKVHLGAIELTDSADDDPPKCPAKRYKAISKSSRDDSIIDLCSDDQNDYVNDTPSKISKCTETLVVELLSSDNEDDDLEFPGNSKEVENKIFHESGPLLSLENPVLALNTGENQPLEVARIDLTTFENPNMDDMSLTEEIQNPPEQETDVEMEVGIGALQDTYNQALDQWNKKLSCLRARGFPSKLITKKISRPLRDITFSDDVPKVDLHTPLFFSQAISDVRSSLAAARKRAKKRRTRALQDALSIQTRQNPTQSALVDVSLAVLPPVENCVDLSLPHSDDLPPDRQLHVEIRAELASVCTSPSDGAQVSIPHIQDDAARSPPNPAEPRREPSSILCSASLTPVPNTSQNPSDTGNSFHTTISLPQQAQSSSSSSPSSLDAQISELTFPSLTETYNEEDEDDNLSLSGLEFSYPSTGVY